MMPPSRESPSAKGARTGESPRGPRTLFRASCARARRKVFQFNFPFYRGMHHNHRNPLFGPQKADLGNYTIKGEDRGQVMRKNSPHTHTAAYALDSKRQFFLKTNFKTVQPRLRNGKLKKSFSQNAKHRPWQCVAPPYVYKKRTLSRNEQGNWMSETNWKWN